VRLSEPTGEFASGAGPARFGKRVSSAYKRPADKPMMMAAKGPGLSRKSAQTPIFGVMGHRRRRVGGDRLPRIARRGFRNIALKGCVLTAGIARASVVGRFILPRRSRLSGITSVVQGVGFAGCLTDI
jgi:hypothetical protein